MFNFDNLLGGKWDHRESDNRNLHAICALLMIGISIFQTSSCVRYTFRASDKEITYNSLKIDVLDGIVHPRKYTTPTGGIEHQRKV